MWRWVPLSLLHTVGKQAACSPGNSVGNTCRTVMPLQGIVHTPQMASHRSKKDQEEWRRNVLPLLYFAISLLHSTNKTQHSTRWQERDVFTKFQIRAKSERKWKSLSYVWLFANYPWNSPGQDTGVGSHLLLQGIFPTQESNPGLPHCRWILCRLSQQGNPD